MSASDSGGVSIFRSVFRASLFAALYLVMMVTSILATRFGGEVSPIWIASAILAWGLIGSPHQEWPLLIVVVGVAHMIGAIIVGDQWPLEAVYFIANLVSPLALAALLRRRDDKLDFESRGDVLRFLFYAAASGGLSSITVGAGTRLLGLSYGLNDLGIWFLSDTLAFIAFLPIIAAIAKGDWRELFTTERRMRTAIIFAVLVAALIVAWFLPSATLFRIFLLLLISYLVYVAFDLSLTGARAAVAMTAFGIVAYTLLGAVPADRGLDPRGFIVAMQIYLAVICVSVLPLAAALAEKQRLYEDASNALHDAQAAWGELLAAEAHYRLIADNANDMVVRLGLDGAILFASPAWLAVREDPETLAGNNLADLAHPDDGQHVRRELGGMIADGALDAPRSLQLRLREMNDDWRLYEARVTLVAPGGGDAEEFIAVLRPVQAE